MWPLIHSLNQHLRASCVSCVVSHSISVQRVYAHESIYEELKQKLVAHVKTLKKGDPLYKPPPFFVFVLPPLTSPQNLQRRGHLCGSPDQ